MNEADQLILTEWKRRCRDLEIALDSVSYFAHLTAEKNDKIPLPKNGVTAILAEISALGILAVNKGKPMPDERAKQILDGIDKSSSLMRLYEAALERDRQDKGNQNAG